MQSDTSSSGRSILNGSPGSTVSASTGVALPMILSRYGSRVMAPGTNMTVDTAPHINTARWNDLKFRHIRQAVHTRELATRIFSSFTSSPHPHSQSSTSHSSSHQHHHHHHHNHTHHIIIIIINTIIIIITSRRSTSHPHSHSFTSSHFGGVSDSTSALF